MRAQWLHSIRVTAGFGRRHRRWLILGSVAAVGVVAMRLALPWTLKTLIDPWITNTPPANGATHALIWGGTFLALMLGLGWADLRERLAFARYAIGTVRDVRAQAFAVATRSGPGGGPSTRRSGDLVARLVGDTARMKAGLKGFLIHVATNGLYLVCLVGILLYIYPPLGLVFAGACVVLAVVTAIGASAIYRRASKYRHKEGKLAEMIRKAADTPIRAVKKSRVKQVNRSSGRQEAALTRIMGLTTWGGHAVFGVGVVLSLWIAWMAADAGRLETSELVLLSMFVLTLRAPTVQLARQGARTGKILACADRVVELMEASGTPDDVEAAPLPTSLTERIEVVNVAIRAPRSRGRRRVLGKINLEVRAGERIMVLGPPGSGKTTLLRVIAGLLPVRRGEVRWDGVPISAWHATSRKLIDYVAENPAWPRQRLRKVLGIKSGTDRAVVETRLRECGLRHLVKRMPDGLKTPLRSDQLSMTERKAVALCRANLGPAALLLLDDPVAGFKERRAARLVGAMLDARRDATVIMACSIPVALDRFDRVIQLDKGRVIFDGTPAERSQRKRDARAASEADADDPDPVNSSSK